MTRSPLSLFPALFFITIMSFPLPAVGGTLSTGVQEILRTATADQEIPVIINLSEKADLGAIKEKNKEKKRERIIKALKDKATITQGPLKAMLKGRGAKRVIPFWIANSIAATVSPALISELMSLPGIESIELDSVIPAPVVMPAAASTPEWNIARINAPALWDVGITGSGVVVANLDTGVDINHPDVQAGWVGGTSGWYNPYADPTNCCYCSNAPRPLSICLANPAVCDPATSCSSCELSASTPCDDSGHGTGTMGVMVGGSAGDSAIGVAPDAKWIGVKIFPSPPAPGAHLDVILQGLEWILSLPAGSEPDVVNNSWGIESAPAICDLFFMDAINNLKAAGIEVVFSAGNSGPFMPSDLSPANNPGAFAVGAIGIDINNNIAIAGFSSRGPSACDGSIFPHVVAPGVGIRLADLTAGGVFPDSYTDQSGTSFSAPHVAGAAALLRSAFPLLTPSEIETALEQSAVPLVGPPPDDTVPNDIYGYGLIDVSGALAYLTSHGEVAIPEIAGYPASYDYGNVPLDTTSSSRTFTITNGSGEPLPVNAITMTGADASEFVIYGDTCSGNTLPPWANCSFTVDVAPASTRMKDAQLNISYGDPATVCDVPLSGYVVDRVIRKQGAVIAGTDSTIQTAYNKCTGGEIIAARAATFGEYLDFNSPLDIAVELQGGYDPSFGSQPGFSAVNALTVSRGVVTVGNVIVR